MKAKGIEINWMIGWANSPSVHVYVDKVPELIYEPHRIATNTALWLGISDEGYADFYSDRCMTDSFESLQDDGFGGRHFTIMTPNGPFVLKGPWSSRSTVMNGLHPLAKDNPIVEVSMTDEADVFKRGYTYFSGAVTIAWLNPLLQEIFGIKMVSDKTSTDYRPDYKLNKASCLGMTDDEFKNLPHVSMMNAQPVKWRWSEGEQPQIVKGFENVSNRYGGKI